MKNIRKYKRGRKNKVIKYKTFLADQDSEESEKNDND
jgi:hypothetical protein